MAQGQALGEAKGVLLGSKQKGYHGESTGHKRIDLNDQTGEHGTGKHIYTGLMRDSQESDTTGKNQKGSRQPA